MFKMNNEEPINEIKSILIGRAIPMDGGKKMECLMD